MVDYYNSMYYRNDPKFLDRLAWANSADPDQRGAVRSDFILFAIPSASFRSIKPHCSNFRVITANFSDV